MVLILSTATPAMLLPTVRSRCVELSLNAEVPAPEEGVLADVTAYLKRVAGGKRSDLLAWCCEKAAVTDNAGAVEFTEAVKTVVTDMLCGRRPDMGLSLEQCWALTRLMDTCAGYLSVNTGVKHVFGLIAVKSIGETAPVEMRN